MTCCLLIDHIEGKITNQLTKINKYKILLYRNSKSSRCTNINIYILIK